MMKRRTAQLAAMLLVAVSLVLTQAVTTPASATEILLDGGFEAGASGDSPNWIEADSLYDTPLCTVALCGTGGGASPPRTGSVWAWFGGDPTAGHTGSVAQTLVIPAGTATLTYWYRNGTVSSPFTATLTVKIDGTTVKTHTEASTAEPAYTQQTVNIDAFANGASHTLSFNYLNGATGTASMVVDDVSIDSTAGGPVVTATPTVTSATPAGPSSSLTPSVVGTAESGSTVTLYSNSTCSSAALGSGTAAAFASTGITATVPANATTTIYAKATKATQTDSACSTTFVSYTNDTIAPDAPTVSAVSPASPGTSTTPSVTGSAEAGSTVTLYPTADCSGPPAATGSAAAFGGAGISALVAADSTTTFKATATDTAGNASPCSSTSVTYVNDSTAPDAPTVSSVAPASPAASTTPSVKGTAEADSTVKLYTTADCSGSEAATGTAADFAGTGIQVTVAAGSTTTFKATATDEVGNVSDCSTSSVTYTQQDPPVVPDTKLTKTPKKKIKTKKKKAKVSFSFSSTTPGVTFQCSKDGGAFVACKSGISYKAKIGKHTFAVRAVNAGVPDATPATFKFKVKKKKKH